MSQYVRVNGIKNLRAALDRGQNGIKKGIESAIWKTAQKAVRPIRRRVPVAFGELSASVQAYQRGAHGNPVTSVDAPHAGSVEVGSRPHTPDFERLLKWVKLRGFQALGGGPRKRGPTSAYQVPRIKTLLKALVVKGKRGGSGSHSPADAAEQVARAISKGIQAHGTKPHWFVRESLGDIREILNTEVRKALNNIKV